MNAQLTLSQQAAYGIEAGSSTIYGDAGEVFTVEQCLMALMLESANEMALGIGEEVCRTDEHQSPAAWMQKHPF